MNVTIRPEIQTLENTIISTRRDVHQHPELAFEEHRTAELVANRLTSLGIDIETGIGKTGVVGTLKGNQKGKSSLHYGKVLGEDGFRNVAKRSEILRNTPKYNMCRLCRLLKSFLEY